MNDSFDIYIFCGGKCGGSTLANTFYKFGYKTIHMHRINNLGFFSDKNIKNLNFKQQLRNSELTILNLINNDSKNKKIYIIDSYRTPIERKISSFFQNIKTHVPNYEIISINDIINIFNDKFLYNLENYHSINEVMNKFNVPLFLTFDFENKYNIFVKNNITFVKILFKDISQWDRILSNLLKKKITLQPYNETDKKDINKIYVEFKKHYRVPKKFINNYLINDKEFKIYNTQKQQEDYINKWNLRSF
jgi:hypothetical protein